MFNGSLVLIDFIVYYAVFLALGVLLALLLRTNRGISMSVAFYAALIVTFANYMWRWANSEPTEYSQNRPRGATQ
jgi:hypothetical protein